MRVSELLAAALLWQSAVRVNIGTVASPEHLRYQRELMIPVAASGLACATLDPTVLAHTALAAHDDLRLYRGYRGAAAQAETPYLLTESGPEPVASAEASVEHLQRSGDELHFDLRMPTRPYSEIELRLRLRDFVGTAVVSGSDAQGRREALGSFGIFDLNTQQLGRWTALPMAETTDPVLHVALSLRTPAGTPIRSVPLAVVEGAAVPPSRLRQTRYTPVAATSQIAEQGAVTVAQLRVPAHVPIERVRFSLPAAETKNFYRDVIVRARPADNAAAETETMDAGAIEHVSLPAHDPRLNPIDVTEDSVDATLGATLAEPAIVRVIVANHGQTPLPVRQVMLEMRERKLCFLIETGMQYTLRYGDAALAAPVYDDTPLMTATGVAAQAQLGPEQRNPHWRPRQDERPYLDRHPELFWLVVLVCGGMMGGTALHYVQHRGGGART